MKIEQSVHDPYDNQIRFDLWLQPRCVETSSRLDDADLDVRADIKKVLTQAGFAICELIRTSTKRK